MGGQIFRAGVDLRIRRGSGLDGKSKLFPQMWLCVFEYYREAPDVDFRVRVKRLIYICTKTETY